MAETNSAAPASRREERMIGPVVHAWFDALVADLSIAEHTLA
jgi:hypothetical protein